jgi:hypothetical protein
MRSNGPQEQVIVAVHVNYHLHHLFAMFPRRVQVSGNANHHVLRRL